MSKTLFQKKLIYMFDQLNMKEKEFVSWFSPKEHLYSARKKVVIDKWLYGEMRKNPYWKFEEYPISKEEIDGSLVFEEGCFTQDKESLEMFKERVDSYILNKVYLSSSQEKLETFEYRYIYYFNLDAKEMFFLKLNIIGKKSNGHYIVELIPSDFYKNKSVEKYIGTLRKEGDHYFISVKNPSETVTFYFLSTRSFDSKEIIYGLSLELSYNHRLPTSKTRAMTKKELTIEEKEKLYVSLNEMEYLIFNEISDDNRIEKRKYFDKFYEKLKNLHSFVKKSEENLREELRGDAYSNIFYDTFYSFYNITKKINFNKRYGVTNKRRAYMKFLESMEQRENSTCYIVNPIDDSYIYLFDEISQDLVQYNITLAQKGLKLELIFVVSKGYQFNDFIEKMVNRLISHNIIVLFSLLDDIEKLSLDSYDFLCSNSDDISLYRATFAHKYLYNITLSKDKIRKLKSDYKKIKKISFTLEKFLLYQKKQDNCILESLVGTWYHYYYGSLKNSTNSLVIWKSELKIEINREVKYIDNNGRVVLKGVINTTFNKKHPFIYLTAIDSGSLALITFENRDIYRGIFKAPILDKKISSSLNMVSFGFFSKEKIEEFLVKKILGEENKILVEEYDIQSRINDYFHQKNYF